MKFVKTSFSGVYIIEPEKMEDERGYFARRFCKNEFIQNGLVSEFVQHSISHNIKRGTLRGMHYQQFPYEETKIVQCIAGEIYDVIVDLRKSSGTYLKWEAFMLSRNNGKMLYIPKGFAHGFQALMDDSDVLYMMDEFYQPGYARGIHYKDEKLNIAWPIEADIIISEKDMINKKEFI